MISIKFRKFATMKNVIFVLLIILWMFTYGYAPKEWHLFLGFIYGVILYGSFDLIKIINEYE